jgi:uncharacterized Zn finger protein
MAANYWSRQWSAQVRELGILGAVKGGRKSGGAATAPTARVRQLEVVPGGIVASLQDRSAGSCTVEIRVAPLSDAQWERIADLLAGQPMLSAQLYSGVVPPEVEQLFAEVGATLIPRSAGEFSFECGACGGQPCRHLALVNTLFAEMLDDDPWLLFLLRGRDRQQITREVREARSAPAKEGFPADAPHASGLNGAAPAAAPAAAAGTANGAAASGEAEAASLLTQLDEYWGNRHLLKQFHHHIAPPAVELTLLRRLGPPVASDEGMAVYEKLVAVYRRVTEEALALAYASDDARPDA